MEISEELMNRIVAYKASPAKLESIREVPLLFMVGVTGAGKDTVLTRLAHDHPDDYQFMVSYTTRQPRSNDGVMEQDGVEYYFIDVDTAERMLNLGSYLETNYYANNIYGTSIDDIALAGRSGKTVIKDVDVNGVDKYMELGMNLKPIFVIPPNFEAWQNRLERRYGSNVDPIDMRRRYKTALEELQLALKHDYYYIVVNDKLDETVKEVHAIAQGKIQERRDPETMRSLQELANSISDALI